MHYVFSYSTKSFQIGQLSNTTSRESNDMLLASADADAKVRTIAVKELIKSIEGKELTSIDDMVRNLVIMGANNILMHCAGNNPRYPYCSPPGL